MNMRPITLGVASALLLSSCISAFAKKTTYTIDLAEHPSLNALSLSMRSGDIVIHGSTDTSSIILKGEDQDDWEGSEYGPRKARKERKEKDNGTFDTSGLKSVLGKDGSSNTGLGLDLSFNDNEVSLQQNDQAASRVRWDFRDDGGYATQQDSDVNDLEITVPEGFALTISTIDGDLDIDGVKGSLTLRSVNGDIVVNGVQSPLSAESVGGDVNLQIISLGDSPSAVHSVNGDVVMVMRPSQAASFEVVTVDGDLKSDLPLVIEDQQSFGGRRSVSASLNKGGAPVQIATVQGDVALKAAK